MRKLMLLALVGVAVAEAQTTQQESDERQIQKVKLLASEFKDKYNSVKALKLLKSETGFAAVTSMITVTNLYKGKGLSAEIDYGYPYFTDTDTLPLTSIWVMISYSLSAESYTGVITDNSLSITKEQTKSSGKGTDDMVALVPWEETQWKDKEAFLTWLGVPKKRWFYIVE